MPTTKSENEDGRGRCRDCGRRIPYEESRPDHLSWVRRTDDRFLPVCRHLPWAEFRALAAKWPPGWAVEKVALKAPSHHYLRVIKVVHELQHPTPKHLQLPWEATENCKLTARPQPCAICGAAYEPHVCGIGLVQGKVTHFPFYPNGAERPPIDADDQ